MPNKNSNTQVAVKKRWSNIIDEWESSDQTKNVF